MAPPLASPVAAVAGGGTRWMGHAREDAEAERGEKA
jgi:hypothetical protein